MRNFRIVIQYEGTRYQGWQRQGTTQNTLQGKFEVLLSKIAGTPVEIQASGRTDAGVHALGQTANFHMNTELSCEELLDKLNQYLPEDVAVISCQEAAPRFHARLNAVGKTYCYRIHNSKIPAVFDRRLVWQIEQQLDVDAMKTAAKYLVGMHDFAAFTSAKNKKKSPIKCRKIYILLIVYLVKKTGRKGGGKLKEIEIKHKKIILYNLLTSILK